MALNIEIKWLALSIAKDINARCRVTWLEKLLSAYLLSAQLYFSLFWLFSFFVCNLIDLLSLTLNI